MFVSAGWESLRYHWIPTGRDVAEKTQNGKQAHPNRPSEADRAGVPGVLPSVASILKTELDCCSPERGYQIVYTTQRKIR